MTCLPVNSFYIKWMYWEGRNFRALDRSEIVINNWIRAISLLFIIECLFLIISLHHADFVLWAFGSTILYFSFLY
jgi:hypothetical protein